MTTERQKMLRAHYMHMWKCPNEPPALGNKKIKKNMKKIGCYLRKIASENLVNVLVLFGQKVKKKRVPYSHLSRSPRKSHQRYAPF